MKITSKYPVAKTTCYEIMFEVDGKECTGELVEHYNEDNNITWYTFDLTDYPEEIEKKFTVTFIDEIKQDAIAFTK